MNTVTTDTKQNPRPAWGNIAPKAATAYCPCCDETRVSDKYQICTACQQYLGEMDEFLAGE